MYPVILFFTSKHCAPCKVVEKKLKKINISMFGNKLNIEKVDIEENFKLTQKKNVLSVPTIIVGGRRLSSSIDEDDLVDAILHGFLSSVEL